MISSSRRAPLTLSLSPANPDALVVAAALKGVPAGQRSASLLRWAAAYLQGGVLDAPAVASALGMSEAELDALLDDF